MKTFLLQPATVKQTLMSVPQSPEPGTCQPLSNRQKWRLSDLAEEAWLHLGQRGLLEGEALMAFRHRIAIGCTGRRISEASQSDYKTLEAKFLALRGESGRAFEAALQSETEPLRIAHHKLCVELRTQGLQPGYAESIARSIFKRSLGGLTTKEVWKVYFTVRNRGHAKHGKGKAANRNKSQRAQRAGENDPF